MTHWPASGSVGLLGPIREFWNQVTTKNQVIIMVFQGSLGGHFCYPSSMLLCSDPVFLSASSAPFTSPHRKLPTG